MTATLPTTFVPNHSPTSAEWLQLFNAVTEYTNFASHTLIFGIIPSTSITSTGTYTKVGSDNAGLFVKQGDSSGGTTGSDVLVFMMGSFYVPTAAPAAGQFGLRFTSTTYDVCRMNINDNNVHHTIYGVRVITGLAAGTYSIDPMLERIGGTASVNIDSNDSASWFVVEMPH